MAYSTYTEVRRVINCPFLEDSDITALILQSDAEIDKMIGAQTAGDRLVEKVSVLLTAQVIKGRWPEARSIGEWTEDWGNIIERWQVEVDRVFSLYKSVRITSGAYQVIDEDERYDESRVRVK